MSIHKKIYDTLGTAVALEKFPVISYGSAPKRDGTAFRSMEVGEKTAKAITFECAPIHVTFKDAEDQALFTDTKQDVDTRLFSMILDFDRPVDVEPFLKKIGRSIPADLVLGTPLLYLKAVSADISLPPAQEPSSGAYIRIELEVRAAPTASG